MTRLKEPISFETTFGVYVVNELLGEGGAGRVYGGFDADETAIALKVLATERANSEKRRRFKNELSFQARNKHRNIVTVIDHGLDLSAKISRPFYVMQRYQSSLRSLMEDGIRPDEVLTLFSQILDGTEAAHMQNVIHRDLKPENILYQQQTKTLAIADFGIAHFNEDSLVTKVETAPSRRVANFVYAAPEQRTPGEAAHATADIYALGLILNEMFTGKVPHGTSYHLIGQIGEQFSFLDDIVAKMLRQNPGDRPASIAEVKRLIRQREVDAVSMQRLSEIEGAVVKTDEIDDPLAITPPKLIDFDWDNGQLTLILDRQVSKGWINALYGMGAYSSVGGFVPGVFVFTGNKAVVQAEGRHVQPLIDKFKSWLPTATQTFRQQLEQNRLQKDAVERERLLREREAIEKRLEVMRRVKI